MTACTLHRLDVDSAPRLRALRLRALKSDPEAFGSSLAETAARPASTWVAQLRELPTWVAELDGVDVGMVRVAPKPVPELISMWVAPEARGQGVGEALVGAVLDWCRAQGLAACALEVRADNAHALALYRRLGFAPLGPGVRGERRLVRAVRTPRA